MIKKSNDYEYGMLIWLHFIKNASKSILEMLSEDNYYSLVARIQFLS